MRHRWEWLVRHTGVEGHVVLRPFGATMTASPVDFKTGLEWKENVGKKASFHDGQDNPADASFS